MRYPNTIDGTRWNKTQKPYPVPLSQRLYTDLAQVMEDWAGTKLKRTSCYGVRLYFRDSVLANHVDRVDTHVISAIINIAQVNMWYQVW